MYLGIDIGTSGVKAVLTADAGGVMATASAPLAVSRPEPDWSEQEPEDWWQATVAAVDALARDHGESLRRVRGIGLSGQMHGATLLDADNNVLRPAILWNDGRSAAECAEIEAACPEARRIAGNIFMPGFTAPKLAWVRKHEPAVFERTARVLLPKDYVRFRLTGEFASDMSDAAGTMWLDVGARAWSDVLLQATGLSRAHMPAVYEGTEATGTPAAPWAERWGIPAEAVVAAGGGDNAASGCGIGAVSPGSAFVSLGTSGVLFVSNAAFSPNTAGAVHAFCHAVPGTWHQMGVILSAAASLEWLAGITGRPAPELADEAAALGPGPGDVLFLPYLSGERTPHNDAHAPGTFVGLRHGTGAGELARAVMEGVGYAFRDCLGVLHDAGTDFEAAIAVGGGARSEAWLQMLATILQRPIQIPEQGDFGAAFGAARLALCAAEGAEPAEVCARPPIRSTLNPDTALGEAYAARYAHYRALYPALKEALAP